MCVTPLAGMTGRAYGYYDEVDSTISLSPRLEAEPIERIQGIVYHELGHAASHLYEAMKTVQMGEENKADAIASAITQRPMRYDRWDVQTTGSGSVCAARTFTRIAARLCENTAQAVRS